MNNINHYNNMVNITNDRKVNALNFLDGIFFFYDNIESLFKFINIFEGVIESTMIIFPSYISQNLLNSVKIKEKEEMTGFKILYFNFQQVDNYSAFCSLRDLINKEYNEELEIFYNKGSDKIFIRLKI